MDFFSRLIGNVAKAVVETVFEEPVVREATKGFSWILAHALNWLVSAAIDCFFGD